jgi:hypothetical protein
LARISQLEESQMNPAMTQLVADVRDDPGYEASMKIFAHSQEFVAPVWSSYLEMFNGGLLDPELKEMVRIKIALNNDCFM